MIDMNMFHNQYVHLSHLLCESYEIQYITIQFNLSTYLDDMVKGNCQLITLSWLHIKALCIHLYKYCSYR